MFIVNRTSVGLSFLALQPNINTLLSNLQNKRTAFDGAAVGLLDTRGLIHDSLAIQQDGAKSLGTAVSLDWILSRRFLGRTSTQT